MTGSPVAMVGLDPDLLDLLLEMPNFELIGIFDPDPHFDHADVPCLGGDENWAPVLERYPGIRVVIGLDRGPARAAAIAHFGADNLVSVVAPGARVSANAVIGAGCALQFGTMVSRNARLGQACKLNVDAAVHHDCHVGDCCTLAPGCRLLGSVTVGDGAYVGSGAIVLPHRRIGTGAVVGAGAVVTRNVPDHAVVAGVPARLLADRANDV